MWTYITRNFVILIGNFVMVVTKVKATTLQSTAHVCRIGETRNAHKILVVMPLENEKGDWILETWENRLKKTRKSMNGLGIIFNGCFSAIVKLREPI